MPIQVENSTNLKGLDDLVRNYREVYIDAYELWKCKSSMTSWKRIESLRNIQLLPICGISAFSSTV